MERKHSGGARIELTGNHTAVVDGCDGVMDYDEETVLLRMGRFAVRFRGRGLVLRRLTENGAVVEGDLASVEYLREP